MFYAVLAEVVYIAKLTNKHILLKYNCTGKSFGSSCCLYNKTLSSYMSDSRLGATHLVGYRLIYDSSS